MCRLASLTVFTVTDLFFAHDVMKHPSSRLTHVVKNVNVANVGKFGDTSFVNSVGMPNQMIGGDYLCGSRGIITEIECGIDSWVAVETLITEDSGSIRHSFCRNCLSEASFILGVTS